MSKSSREAFYEMEKYDLNHLSSDEQDELDNWLDSINELIDNAREEDERKRQG